MILNCLEHKLLKEFFGPRMTVVVLKIIHPFKYPRLRVMSSEYLKN